VLSVDWLLKAQPAAPSALFFIPLSAHSMTVNPPKQDAASAAKKSAESDTVKFNVGGRVFEAPLAMLQQHPHAMLGTMFSSLHHVEPNAKGEFAFYRDPDAFEKIMELYRTGRVNMSAMTFDQAKVLFADAKYAH
jgi:hypothetical protein